MKKRDESSARSRIIIQQDTETCWFLSLCVKWSLKILFLENKTHNILGLEGNIFNFTKGG